MQPAPRTTACARICRAMKGTRERHGASASVYSQAHSGGCTDLEQPFSPHLKRSKGSMPQPPLSEYDWWQWPEVGSPADSAPSDLFSTTESYPNPSLLWSSAAPATNNTSRDYSRDLPRTITCSLKHISSTCSSETTAGAAVAAGLFSAARSERGAARGAERLPSQQTHTSVAGCVASSGAQCWGSPCAVCNGFYPLPPLDVDGPPVDTDGPLVAISTELSGDSVYSAEDSVPSPLLSRITLGVQSQIRSCQELGATVVELQHAFAAQQPPTAVIPVHKFLTPIKVCIYISMYVTMYVTMPCHETAPPIRGIVQATHVPVVLQPVTI